MLNFRLLYTVLNPHPVSIYLGILGSLGFVVLLDIVLFLKLALLVGPWVLIAFLSVLTAIDVWIVYKLVDLRSTRLLGSIHNGVFDEVLFTNYTATLIAGIFLVPPGLVNKIIGIIILTPSVSKYIGNKPMQSSGINWTEAYEYLRLNSCVNQNL